MKNKQAQKLFGYTLLIVIGFLFIWTGGPTTFNAVMDSVTSNGEYKASLPPTSDLIVHGGLLAVTIYIAMSVVGESVRKGDLIPEGKLSINYFNLIQVANLPQHLISKEDKDKSKKKVDEKEEDPKFFTRKSKGIPDNSMKKMSEIIKRMEGSNDLTEKRILEYAKERQKKRDKLLKLDKPMIPPPYPDQDFMDKDLRLDHMSKFNKQALEENFFPISERRNQEAITNSLKGTIPSDEKPKETSSKGDNNESSDTPRKGALSKYLAPSNLLGKKKKTNPLVGTKPVTDLLMEKIKKTKSKDNTNEQKVNKDNNYSDRPSKGVSHHFKS